VLEDTESGQDAQQRRVQVQPTHAVARIDLAATDERIESGPDRHKTDGRVNDPEWS
jgi:hypothetical protein